MSSGATPGRSRSRRGPRATRPPPAPRSPTNLLRSRPADPRRDRRRDPHLRRAGPRRGCRHRHGRRLETPRRTTESVTRRSQPQGRTASYGDPVQVRENGDLCTPADFFPGCPGRPKDIVPAVVRTTVGVMAAMPPRRSPCRRTQRRRAAAGCRHAARRGEGALHQPGHAAARPQRGRIRGVSSSARSRSGSSTAPSRGQPYAR